MDTDVNYSHHNCASQLTLKLVKKQGLLFLRVLLACPSVMSKRDLQAIDPANILVSGWTRNTRMGPTLQQGDIRGQNGAKEQVQSPTLPLISLASDLELSPPMPQG